MRFQYCPECGGKLIMKAVGDEGEVPFCEKCSRPFFDFTYPCVICLCIDEDENIILVKHSYGIDRYACVAGYIKSGESAEETIKREVKEEIGLDVISAHFLYSRYYEKHDNLMLAFYVRVKNGGFTLSGEIRLAERFTAEKAAEVLSAGTYGVDMLRMYQETKETKQL